MNSLRLDRVFQLISMAIACGNLLVYIVYITKFGAEPSKDFALALYTQLLGVSGVLSGIITYLYPSSRRDRGLSFFYWSLKFVPIIGVFIVSASIEIILSSYQISISEKMTLVVLGGLAGGALVSLAITVQEFNYNGEYLIGQLAQLAYTTATLGLVYISLSKPIQIINITAMTSTIIAILSIVYYTRRAVACTNEISNAEASLFPILRRILQVVPLIITFSLGSVIDPFLITKLDIEGYTNYVLSNRLCIAFTTLIGAIYILKLQNRILKHDKISHCFVIFYFYMRQYIRALFLPLAITLLLLIILINIKLPSFVSDFFSTVAIQQCYSLIISSPIIIITVAYAMLIRVVISKSIRIKTWFHAPLWGIVYIATAAICKYLDVTYIFELSSVVAWMCLWIISLVQLYKLRIVFIPLAP